MQFSLTQMTGTIPLELMQLTKLRELPTCSLSPRRVTCQPCAQISFCILEQLALWGNQFSGNIPSIIRNLTRLGACHCNDMLLVTEPVAWRLCSRHVFCLFAIVEALAFDSNRLTGEIPSEISLLVDLGASNGFAHKALAASRTHKSISQCHFV